ncbi:hypothetical protein AB0M42_22210 [Streptomyces sp. NPDC051784]|uniref:hypothetical protein n=1 Tax=Streptomyces sp. NPDC051784 TaxID=3155805 RepID=UPI0034180634
MAHHRQTGRDAKRSAPSIRRALRREAPTTVGLLVDAEDFAAMRRYRSFVFDDHVLYLQQVEALLRSLSGLGMHTSVALFDPEDYAEYCSESGLDPDERATRSRFTAEVAATGATVAYTGQPLDTLIPLLVSRAVRHATWEYATVLLAGLGDCADCGQDIGRAAFDRASHLLTRLLETAGPGTHHVVCSTPSGSEQLLAVLHTTRGTDGPALLDSSEGAEFAGVLAVGVATETMGGVVLRTSAPGAPDRVHGWRLERGGLLPLTAGEVFSAYCTDADTGEPVSPESGVEYCAGFDIGADEPETHR